MLTRVGVIAWNTYREAVRARILHGLFALAVATALYAIIVGKYTSKNALRVISDVGAFSISAYAVVVAIVMGASSLYRELELKTVFPILARPLYRGEYLAGKYLGTLFTLSVFMAANCGVLLLCLSFMQSDSLWQAPAVGAILSVLAVSVAWRSPNLRTAMPVLWGGAMLIGGYVLASGAIDDRQVVLASAALSLFEVSIIAAMANLFSSFSSPFLTAVLTFGVFLVGRSADTLAKLPPKVFGEALHDLGVAMSKVVPNLMVYVPARPLLTGESSEVSLIPYLGAAFAQALGWSVALLVVAGLLFRKRDFV